MKRIVLILAVVFMTAIVFNSCKKQDNVVNPQTKEYVNTIAGSFVAQEGDITLKSADLNKVTRTWSMYAVNSPFYGAASIVPNYSLVDGREFITGSAAYNFWSSTSPVNNPVSFNISQDNQVYSNLTPNEDLRCVLETKNLADEVIYLGMIDFKPSLASFPMTVNGFRLGDKLTIDASALYALPGGNRISISVNFTTKAVNLPATKKAAITGASTQPSGTAFQWSDVVYGGTNTQDVVLPYNTSAGQFELYNELSGKVTGDVTITVTDSGSPLSGPTGGYNVHVTIPNEAGIGHALTLSTTKIGWFDGDFIHFFDTDISVNTIPVPVN